MTQPDLSIEDWVAIARQCDHFIATEATTGRALPLSQQVGPRRRLNLPELLLKACPNCGGDLTAEDEGWGYGDYNCLQCGRAFEVTAVHPGDDGHHKYVLDRVGTRLNQQAQEENGNGKKQKRQRRRNGRNGK